MKKIIIFLITLSIVSCGKKSEKAKNNKNPGKTVVKKDSRKFLYEDGVEIKDLKNISYFKIEKNRILLNGKLVVKLKNSIIEKKNEKELIKHISEKLKNIKTENVFIFTPTDIPVGAFNTIIAGMNFSANIFLFPLKPVKEGEYKLTALLFKGKREKGEVIGFGVNYKGKEFSLLKSNEKVCKDSPCELILDCSLEELKELVFEDLYSLKYGKNALNPADHAKFGDFGVINLGVKDDTKLSEVLKITKILQNYGKKGSKKCSVKVVNGKPVFSGDCMFPYVELSGLHKIKADILKGVDANSLNLKVKGVGTAKVKGGVQIEAPTVDTKPSTPMDVK
jgi:hypothetical protein